MPAIYRTVEELRALSVAVLSPADPRVVDTLGEFLFVASDPVRSIRLVQERHLESIRASDFLWLVTPDGYVGQSASMELGFAVAYNIPVFCSIEPADQTLQQYVHQVASLRDAVDTAASLSATRRRYASFLIDPHGAIQRGHDALQRIDDVYSKRPDKIDDDDARQIGSLRRSASAVLSRLGTAKAQR